MLTKQDLMKLSKERLCELLLEEWSKKDTLKPFEFPSLGMPDCYHGGPCTNPFHDCIDCPRIFSGGTSECGIGLTTKDSKCGITTHEAVTTQDGLILTSKEK